MSAPQSVHSWIPRTGSIWDNTKDVAKRRKRPDRNSEVIDTLQAGQPLIILCYSMSDHEESWEDPERNIWRSKAWDFVVTSDDDSGGYVADVYVNTYGIVTQQLGPQGACNLLKQRLV